MKQEAVITVFGLSFSSYCEKLITDTFENNSTKVRAFLFIEQALVAAIFCVTFNIWEPFSHNPCVFNPFYFVFQGKQAMEHVIGVINQEIQDLAAGLEQATTKLNTEFEHATAVINSELNDIAQGAKNGFEQATRLNTAFCEQSSS